MLVQGVAERHILVVDFASLQHGTVPATATQREQAAYEKYHDAREDWPESHSAFRVAGPTYTTSFSDGFAGHTGSFLIQCWLPPESEPPRVGNTEI